MMNKTLHPELPPLPQYEVRPLQPLISWLPDEYLVAALPVIAYWIVSFLFHIIDVYDLFPQYRLHTPAEILHRNHVTRWDVFRDVLIQQLIQTFTGIALTVFDPPQTTGKDEYNVHLWAQRIRIAERAVPTMLGLLGLDSSAIAEKITNQQPYLAGVLRGGHYPGLLTTVNFDGHFMSAPAFAPWELQVSSFIYWWGIQAVQVMAAIVLLDTWQYFWHRAMHLNKYLYTHFHYRHHRLYVPYAYGALYNHPVEGFLLDTLGAAVAYLVTGMTVRQAMVFFTISTVKTVDDHCGYALPWDPLQLITSNNAGYHDVHHQSWGIKTNFSQPFFTFWDRIMGTQWTGGDVSVRYERSKRAAEAKMGGIKRAPITGSDASESKRADDSESEPDPITAMYAEIKPSAPAGKAVKQAGESRLQVLQDKRGGGISVLQEEAAEEERALAAVAAASASPRSTRRSPRKKSSASSTAEGSLKGLTEKVSSAMHSGVGGVLKGADS